MKHEILYADPPWPDKPGRMTPSGIAVTSGRDHYQTMTWEQLRAMPVTDWAAPDALLFLWVPGRYIKKAIGVGEAWGFRYVTVAFVWYKERPHFAPYTMSQCEFVLLMRRGRIPHPRGIRNARQIWIEKPREHSRKPDGIRDTIDAMFPTQRKIELFARTRTPGWDAHGDQTDLFEREESPN